MTPTTRANQRLHARLSLQPFTLPDRVGQSNTESRVGTTVGSCNAHGRCPAVRKLWELPGLHTAGLRQTKTDATTEI